MASFADLRILLLGERGFKGFARWYKYEQQEGQMSATASWEAATALIDQNHVDAIVVDYQWLVDVAPLSYMDFFRKAVSLPIIVIISDKEPISRVQLIALGAQSVWTIKEVKYLELDKLLESACARQDRVTMLEREHREVASLLNSIKQGDVHQIESHDAPSGMLKILDARLVEENARLLLKVQAQNKQLKHVTMHDMLTGLASRMHFEKALEKTLARSKRHQHIFSVLFLDLDKFKLVNDSYGHHVGDVLLKQVALRLKNTLRSEDFIARLSGDEFAVIIHDLKTPEKVGVIAAKMIKAISEQSYFIDNVEINTTTSIGVACFPFAGEDAPTLLRHADLAMYRAKSSGRNHYQYFTDDINREHLQRMSLENALGFALERNEMTLKFQPLIKMPGKKIYGVEVLLRWLSPEFGAVPADIFIPIAEECGVIHAMGLWVIETALAQFATWKKTHVVAADFVLSINLSAKQLTHPDLFDDVKKLTQQYHIDPSCIEFELTETAMMVEDDHVASGMIDMGEYGFKFAMDDFGTGYSSLSHLKDLPVSTLKIDRSFVEAIDSSKNAAVIVKSTIAMAQNLGLKVLAEGVETKKQLDFLLKHGCDYMQGFYFFEPLTVVELEAVL